MTDYPAETDALTRDRASSGASLLTLGGLAASFGLAACCALPLLLTTLGLGTAWLAGIATLAAPNRSLLLAVGALCLGGGAILLWRQQRHAASCGSNGICTPPLVRGLTLVGLLIGAALLYAGYLYV